MKAALFLVLSVSYAAPAFSQPANRAAAAEATRYLIPCNQVAAGDRQFCPPNQANFLDDYVHAMAGDPRYIDDLANFFGTWATSDPRPSHPGVRQDRQEGCAWLLVEAAFTASGEARDRLASQIYLACIDFTAQARLAIWLRATDLVGKIRAHPINVPEEKPLTAAEQRCLKTVVCSLDQDCDIPPPPPGCPR